MDKFDMDKLLRLKELLTRFLLGMVSGDSEDPYAEVRVPKSRRPSGRTSSVAVEEPDEPRLTSAVSRSTR
jgi:hypothetical protein